MRGRDAADGGGQGVQGITPARAGKRYFLHFSLELVRDHPRACGEESAIDATENKIKGSPPRVRGRVRQFQPDANFPGITPARAGKRAW